MTKAGPVIWYGGKALMLGKIVPLIPWSTVYVEPYGGAASVLCNLKPRPVEVYNDLNGELVNLFRVLQGETQFNELLRRLTFTLYSLDEFRKALGMSVTTHDPVAAAWAMFVRQNQGFGGRAETEGNWGRAFISSRGMAHACSKWLSRIDRLPFWHDRIMRVQIDNRPALDVIRYWDSPETTFYCDPPYVHEMRVAGNNDVYRHEMTAADHAALVETLLAVKGNVVLSGYAQPIYAPLEAAGWKRIDWHTACSAAGRARGSKLRGEGALLAGVPRVETVWLRDTTCAQQGSILV